MLIHESDLQLITTDVTHLLFSQKIWDDACSSVSRYLRLELHCDLQDGAKPIHPSVTQRQRTGNTPQKTHARTRVSSSSSAWRQTDPPPPPPPWHKGNTQVMNTPQKTHVRTSLIFITRMAPNWSTPLWHKGNIQAWISTNWRQNWSPTCLRRPWQQSWLPQHQEDCSSNQQSVQVGQVLAGWYWHTWKQDKISHDQPFKSESTCLNCKRLDLGWLRRWVILYSKLI